MEGLAGPSLGLSSWYIAFKSFVSTYLSVPLTLLCVITSMIHLVGNLVATSHDRGGLDATGRAIKGGGPGSEWAIVPFENQGA